MRDRKFSLTALITLILTVSLPIANLPPLFQVSQVLAQTPQDRKAEADRLFKQGGEQYQTNQFKVALQSWKQALKIYQALHYSPGEGAASINIGLVYYSFGNYTKAIDYGHKSLVIAREIKDRRNEGEVLRTLSEIYLSSGDYAVAIDYSWQSLIIAREFKNRQSEILALGNLGNAYYQQGDYPKAIEYYQQALSASRDIKNLQLETLAQQGITAAQKSINNPQKAEADRLLNQGIQQYQTNHFETALKLLQQALIIYREIRDRQGEGQSLGNLGNVYLNLGDYTKAIEYQQYSLAILREINDEQGEGQSLGDLGIVYLHLGDYTKAIECQQQRLSIARKIKDYYSEGKALNNLSGIYIYLGEYLKAIDYLEQRLKIAQKINDYQGEGAALANLGNAYLYLGDYAKAIDYSQQFLTIAQEFEDLQREGKALGNLGNAYLGLGEYQKAIEYQQQWLAIAREIKYPQGEEAALSSLGTTYLATGNYAKAIDYNQQFLTIAQKIKDRHSEGIGFSNLGIAFYKASKFTLSEQNLFQGLKVWETLRNQKLNDTNKVSFFETQKPTYNYLQQVLIAQNKTKEALEISERGRARAFVELLTSRLSGKSISQIPDKPTISLLQQIAKQQNATLVEYSIIGDDFKIQGKQETKESELYIWVIKPTGEVTFRKADLKPLWQKENTTLAKLVTTSRNSIGARGTAFRGINVVYNPNAPKTKNNLKRLHELLINPIADLLPKNSNDRVIFIPQSSLFLVPFAALQDADGKYLIEKHTILTSPSIQVLDLTHKQKQRIGTKPIQGKDTLIVGNPTMPFVAPKIGETPQQLIPLPGAEQEATAISKLLKTEPLIGNKATEATVVQRLPQARFVHLATHGIFDDVQGLNSGIALTPSGKDDGLLTASEILDLKLNAELVVLSACDTGRGRLTGDGVIGLSRSLISAGVPSVLVSLWSVPDAPTALLMTEFYQNLQKSPDKAQALRQAMLTTMKNHPNPVDWAAFTLIGEAQ
ncbi:MAG: CHAT domain-containing protein [Aulosira sp. DedQUE10]|nr:CHAT domain-containing protein [Aulosira sp. DedQUE10]